MLVIRMQRTGRKGHAMFRVVVQDSRRTPTSGKVVALLGSYDPHSKTVQLNKERAEHYLKNGAQPSDRVAYLLQAEGVKLPSWVKISADKKRTVRNADKRRSTRPDEPEAPAEEVVEEAVVAEEPAADAPVETAKAAPAEEAATEEPEAEATAEEVADEAKTEAESADADKEAPAES